MPAEASSTPPPKGAQASAKAPAANRAIELKFRERVAAIVAEKPAPAPRSWSDIDRDRLVDQFRLPDSNQPDGQTPDATNAGLVSMVRRREDVRGMTFGFDSGSANLGPPVDAAARPAEVVAYQLSEQSTCNGLMPGVQCNTIGGDDVSVRLALALNF